MVPAASKMPVSSNPSSRPGTPISLYCRTWVYSELTRKRPNSLSQLYPMSAPSASIWPALIARNVKVIRLAPSLRVVRLIPKPWSPTSYNAGLTTQFNLSSESRPNSASSALGSHSTSKTGESAAMLSFRMWLAGLLRTFEESNGRSAHSVCFQSPS